MTKLQLETVDFYILNQFLDIISYVTVDIISYVTVDIISYVTVDISQLSDSDKTDLGLGFSLNPKHNLITHD